jgi:hypothetical protein
MSPDEYEVELSSVGINNLILEAGLRYLKPCYNQASNSSEATPLRNRAELAYKFVKIAEHPG